MADYNVDELSELVKADILAESQGVGEVPVVTSLSGINSLPALRGNEVVEAPLSLLSKPAEDAAKDAYAAIGNVQTATDNAMKAAVSANQAAERVDESILDLQEEKQIIAGVDAAEKVRVASENERIANENERKEAENARVSAETARENRETARQTTETARVSAENDRAAAEKSRDNAEKGRATAESSRVSAENVRRSNEVARENTHAEMKALNKELKENPPRINADGNWELWDAADKTYHDTKQTALGKSPIIVDGVWWIWNDDKDDFESTGWAVNSDYVLTKEKIEGVLGGAPMMYIEEWKHTHVPFKGGGMVKFNQEIYIALRDTDVPPVNLLLLGDGIIAKVDEHTYATIGSFDAVGNKDDWRKMPLDELRLISREGTLDGTEVDVRDLSGDDVYRFEPNLAIDFVKGTIKGKKVDLKLPKKNVTDALGYVPASTAQHEALTKEVQKQGVRLDSLEENALVSTYTLEQSSNPAFEVSNKNAAKLYVSKMGGYLFYNGNVDGKVYAAKLNPYDWGKFADGTPVTEAIEANTETMVHVPECHFKASGKTMSFGGVIPIDGGHTFGSPHWIGAYKGSIADGALHSRPNVAPSRSQTMSAFGNYAQATHANEQYGLANYQFHCLINALFQASFGNLNSQEVIGAGFQTSSWEAARDVPMGKLKSLGDGSGKVYYNDATIGDQYPVKLFGFEDLWGKLWEFRPGIRFEMRNGIRYAIVYDGNKVSNTATGRELITAVQSASGVYVKSMKLGEYWDMVAESIGDSGTTHYCDGVWANANGEIMLAGARADDDLLKGISSMATSANFGFARDYYSARLAYWGEPEIIGGAQLVAMINS